MHTTVVIMKTGTCFVVILQVDMFFGIFYFSKYFHNAREHAEHTEHTTLNITDNYIRK